MSILCFCKAKQILAVIFACLLFFSSTAYGQAINEKDQEIVDTCNQVMKNIYNDIWRIKNFYKELKDFGPENYSDNPEVPKKFSAIKTIRLKSKESLYSKPGHFQSDVYRADFDQFYIFFGTQSTAWGARSSPAVSFYIKEFGLYLLVYSKSNNHHLRNHIFKIVGKNTNLNSLER
ncbi:MAG: hypothetical protein Q8O30_11830 [Candidatus Omnitrophota bacterium]|nr:hypothetical protein [Candidatus Omnitrophota bacterium]